MHGTGHFVRLVLALAFTVAFTAPAQSTWFPNGTRVSDYPASDNPQICGDGVGGAFVIWRDFRNISGDVFGQHILGDGSLAPGWPIEGLPICTNPATQIGAIVVPDGVGGMFVAWVDYRDGQTNDEDIYATRVTASGQIAAGWPPDGFPVCVEVGSQEDPTLVSDGSGGVFIAWDDTRAGPSNENIFLQHLTGDGKIVDGWPVNGRLICPSPTGRGQGGPVLMVDGRGGFILCWTESGPIHAVRLTASGDLDPSWPPCGLVLCPAPCRGGSIKLCSDGVGGAFAAWTDYRSAPPNPPNIDFYADVYAGHVTADGQVPPGWPADGLPIAALYDTQWDQHVVADGGGGFFITWVDYRSNYDPYYADLYVQHVMADGSLSPGWPPNGRLASTAPGYQLNPAIAADERGGAYIAFANFTGDYKIFAQHVDGTGGFAGGWPSAGIALADTVGDQLYPQILGLAGGDAIVVWEDTRDHGNYQIYAQRLVTGGPVPTLVSLVSAEARPDMVTLIWYGALDATTEIAVYRRTAATDWIRVGTPASSGTGMFRFDDRNVTPGQRYAYRLGYPDGGREAFTAETWVDVPTAFTFTLEGLRPNPARGELVASFSLPSAEPAKLELLDLSGRRVLEREVGSLGAGRHLLRLEGGRPVSAGIYWLRLRQGERTLTARGVVVP